MTSVPPARAVSASPRAHAAFDRLGTDPATRTHRVFMPLVDPAATAVLPVYGYWYDRDGSPGGDTDPLRPMTIAAAVESDHGAVIPFAFGGRSTFTFPGGDGSGAVLAIPDEPRPFGAQVRTTSTRGEPISGCWLRTRVSPGGPVPLNLGAYHQDDATAHGELTRTGSGPVTGGGSALFYGPVVVHAEPSGALADRPVVALISDSILDGLSEGPATPFFGPVARACVDLGVPLVKCSKAGSGTRDMAPGPSSRYRARFLDGATHALVAVGTNDGLAHSDAGVAELRRRLLALCTMLTDRGIRTWMATVPPRTRSSDRWQTTQHQTPVAGSQSTHLAAVNAWIRSTPAPLSGCLDLAARCEPPGAPDSGLWNPGATLDGVHPAAATMVCSITNAITELIASWSLGH